MSDQKWKLKFQRANSTAYGHSLIGNLRNGISNPFVFAMGIIQPILWLALLGKAMNIGSIVEHSRRSHSHYDADFWHNRLLQLHGHEHGRIHRRVHHSI